MAGSALSAVGGAAYIGSPGPGGAGGGRIAVYNHVPESERQRLAAGLTPFVSSAETNFNRFLNLTAAATNSIGYPSGNPSQPGTMRLFTGPPAGLLLILR